MVSVVTLTRIQLLENAPQLADLRSRGSIYCSTGDEHFLAALQDAGIAAEPTPPDGVPDGSVLILYAGPLYDLVSVAHRLLGPGGCPWDQAQTHESLKKYLLEEVYEAFEAIDEKNDVKLREELGDVLLQPIMHAEMKKLAGVFDIDDVAEAIVDKLVRRHPHVFGETVVEDAAEVLKNWDKIKKSEKTEGEESILGTSPKAMPSLLRAHEVSKRAVRAGFEWPDVDAVFEKLAEEVIELRNALANGQPEEIEAEIGDLLFTAVNLARWAKVEPEEALRKMVTRFTQRFHAMERNAKKPLDELTPQEWDDLWEDAKRARA